MIVTLNVPESTVMMSVVIVHGVSPLQLQCATRVLSTIEVTAGNMIDIAAEIAKTEVRRADQA